MMHTFLMPLPEVYLPIFLIVIVHAVHSIDYCWC